MISGIDWIVHFWKGGPQMDFGLKIGGVAPIVSLHWDSLRGPGLAVSITDADYRISEKCIHLGNYNFKWPDGQRAYEKTFLWADFKAQGGTDFEDYTILVLNHEHLHHVLCKLEGRSTSHGIDGKRHYYFPEVGI